jgi:hypothetical protein
MIEVPLGNLAESVEALKVLYNEKLPIRVSYRLSKMMDSIQSELNKLQEAMIELAKKYGDPVNDRINIREENKEEFKKLLIELGEETVKFDFDKLQLPETILISAKHIKDLNYFIELGA